MNKKKEKKDPVENQLPEKEWVEKEQYQRLLADFENYKKRMAKEQAHWVLQGNKQLLKALIPVVDDIQRSASSDEQQKDVNALAEGIALIVKKFSDVLKKHGLEMISVEKGDHFDASSHEALAVVPVDDPALEGKVIEVVEKGYKLNGMLLRAAKVTVGAS